MADLINTFSWSYSAASAFDACRRKRYWSKYAAWGGWNASAPDLARRAYRLNKMDSRHTLLGRVVEDTIMWLLREHQAGRTHSTSAAYEQIARPALNAAWKASRSGAWKTDPRNQVCLHEHYYPALHENLDPKWTETLRERVERCLENFLAVVLPRLADVDVEREIPVALPGQGQGVEQFVWDGITVYAIPDYAYRAGEDGAVWHIHDWKTGRPRPEHRNQVAVYGLWAHEKHGVPPDRIRVFLEYLNDGVVAEETLTADLLDETRAAIRASVMDMADYLEDADIRRNRPRPRDEWDMTPDRDVCRRCPFYELCEPEFEDAAP